jgi:hypothetical protein
MNWPENSKGRLDSGRPSSSCDLRSPAWWDTRFAHGKALVMWLVDHHVKTNSDTDSICQTISESCGRKRRNAPDGDVARVAVVTVRG